MKKLKMVKTNELTFEEGCNMYLEDCRQRNLRDGTIIHYPAYKNGGLNVSELARVCDLSRTTVYKYISLLEV